MQQWGPTVNDCKRCRTCGEVKALESFPPDRRQRDGCGGECRPCKANRKRAWVEANREHIRAYARTDAVKAKNRRWKAKNRDVMAKRRREWYEANRGHCLAYAAEYVRLHPERSAAVAAQRMAESAALSESYVRRLLSNSGFPIEAAPAALIELKREQLSLRRLTRQLKQELEKLNGN